MWVIAWGIFGSSENYDLFDRFRSSYGDVRLLEEAPGHLCQGYEEAEVATLAQVGMLFVWDLCLVPSSKGAYAEVSHDECVDVWFSDPEQRKRLQELLGGEELRR